MPIAMIFRAPDTIEKEELAIPKKEGWYVKLTPTPNRVIGENVLGYFLYPPAGSFANPPTTTEGAHIPNPRPLRAVTSAGKEILYLSSEESVGSSYGELSSWSNVFAGVLRDLGIDPEEKKKKPTKRKKVITLVAEVTSKKGESSRATASAADKGTLRFCQSNLEDYIIISDSLEGLSRIGEKKTSAAGSKSSVSVGSRNPDAGATPSSIAVGDDEEEEEEEEEPAEKLVSRKRNREETTAGASVAQKAGGEKKASEKPVGGEPKETGAAATTAHEKTQGPEVVRITGLDQPLHETRKKPEIEKPTKPAQPDAPLQTVKATSAIGGSGFAIHREKIVAAGGAGSGGTGGFVPQSPIGPKDTVGDIYYKTYTEEARGDTPHQAPWGLKQKDTFMEFSACRDWFLNSFPLGEVNRQRARTHDGLYQAYVVGEANTRAASHQILREWRTMVKERADWENYRERPVRGKLRAAEELLSKERVEFKKICEKDNQRPYAARNKITYLEAQNSALSKKVEDLAADKKRVEAELKTQVSSKDRDLAAKDVEIAELKHRLREQTDKSESLEIDLESERVKAATAEEAKKKAEEARDVSTAALNVAQNNYSGVQGIVDTLDSEAEWMRGRGVVLMANSILNASELDGAVATLIDASRAVGHCGGYLECAQHVEEALDQAFDVNHCSVTDQAEAELAHTEKAYDHLSLPIMDMVAKALEHDDWCQRLKQILDPPVTVELSDGEEPTGDDGGDGDGNDDDDGGDGYE
ncbi:hypothetical protein HanRHA438_Chr01g0008481 [Helianthus annuus]|nr:hypothetical protein HanRHA438_Chr01g0008481 [Helianthus annuus]KAJ0955869.1 hypothetical protein HanPSC8_Chr01g0007921 [Helianthus annuus]